MSIYYEFVEIANTDGDLKEFPWTIAINDKGVVTWKALLDDGGSGIYAGQTPPFRPKVYQVATTDLDTGLGPTINDRGSVAFYKEIAGSDEQTGIYLSSNFRSGRSTILAYKGQDLSDVTGREGEIFTGFFDDPGDGVDPAINKWDQVAFLAGLTDNNSGLFIADKKDLYRIADTVDEFSGLEFFDFFGTPFEGDVAPAINDNGRWGSRGANRGQVAFWASLDEMLPEESPEYEQIPGDNNPGNVRGIYLATGSEIVTVADNRGDILSFTGAPTLNDDGDVAYIFRGDGEVTDPTIAIPSFQRYRGINLYEGGSTKTVVDNNQIDDLIYGGSPDSNDGVDVDRFYLFGFVGLNNEDSLTFSALFDPTVGDDDGPPTLGIFTAMRSDNNDWDIHKVIAQGDQIKVGSTTKTVADLRTSTFFTKGLNDNGQIAFSAILGDDSEAIFRADPVLGGFM